MDNEDVDKTADSLEQQEDVALPQPTTGLDQPSGPGRLRGVTSRRLLLGAFGLIIVIGIILVVIALLRPHKAAPATVVINTQSLDNGTLNKLTSQQSKNNTVTQQLTISPSTLFKNNVTIQGDANVQKNLDVGGNLTVKGSSNLLGPVATGSNLAVGGSLSVSGLITAGSLSVGSINLSTLSLSGNLSFGGHLITTGTVPVIKTDVAAGGGASATIAGNDTSGTVIITAGSSGLQAGELAIISFHTTYGLAARVQLTPVTSAAASLPYFVSQSAKFFTIETAAAPTAGAVYEFNYFATQ